MRSSRAEVKVLTHQCAKLRKELSRVHDNLHKHQIQSRQTQKELDELLNTNARLQAKNRSNELQIKRLKKSKTKGSILRKKVETQSEIIKTLKEDVDFLEQAFDNKASDHDKYRRLTQKRIAKIAKEREDVKDSLFREKILNDCQDIEKDELQTKIVSLENVVSDLKRQNILLQNKCDECVGKLEEKQVLTLHMQQDLEAELFASETSHADLVEIRNQLLADLDEAKHRVNAMRKTSLSQEDSLTTLSKRNDELEEEVKTLKQRMCHSTKQNEMLGNELSCLEMKFRARKKRNQELEKIADERNDLLLKAQTQAKLDRKHLTKENAELRNKFEKLDFRCRQNIRNAQSWEKKVYQKDAESNLLQLNQFKEAKIHARELSNISVEVQSIVSQTQGLSSVLDWIEPTSESICLALKRVKENVESLCQENESFRVKERWRNFDEKTTEQKLERSRCIEKIQQNLDNALKEAKYSVARERLKIALDPTKLDEIILRREVEDLEKRKNELEADLGLLHI